MEESEMKKLLAFCLLAAMLLSLCACVQVDTPPETDAPPANGEYRVKDAGTVTVKNDTNSRIYYHIFVGSFSDSDGDGIGDLRGIINRFDYLNDGDDNSGLSLGVEGIWLSPIFVSSSYHKYDTGDYYQVDPQFGTEADLKELIDLCHSRNVQIILDLVINHTATSHPWFRAFVEAQQYGDTENEYYDFYSWTDSPKGGKTYNTIAGTTKKYECNFSSSMPELNYDNPAVRQAVLDVAKYYLDLGVDGFRFDAAKYIYYGEGEPNHQFWDWYMGELRKIKPDIYTVAEVWDSDGITIPYFSSTNCFNFYMAQANGLLTQTAQAGDVNILTSYVERYYEQIRALRDDAMLVSFLANHDTDRAAGFLTVASGQAKVAANLTMLMPGSSFIYYGEEIGMKGSRGGAMTDANRRLAMNWGDGDTVRDPVGADYASGQTNGTVMEQIKQDYSLYTHYKKLIAIRKANPEIAQGDFKALTIEGSKLGGFVFTLEGSSVIVLHNTSNSSITIDLTQITDLDITTLAAFAGMADATLEGTTLTIGRQTSVVLR